MQAARVRHLLLEGEGGETITCTQARSQMVALRSSHNNVATSFAPNFSAYPKTEPTVLARIQPSRTAKNRQPRVLARIQPQLIFIPSYSSRTLRSLYNKKWCSFAFS